MSTATKYMCDTPECKYNIVEHIYHCSQCGGPMNNGRQVCGRESCTNIANYYNNHYTDKKQQELILMINKNEEENNTVRSFRASTKISSSIEFYF